MQSAISCDGERFPYVHLHINQQNAAWFRLITTLLDLNSLNSRICE